jgi:MFS family permease
MSGNAYVTDSVPAEVGRAAISAYSIFSNISGIISPTILGAIAELWGIQGAFTTSVVLSLLGVSAMLYLVGKSD